MRVFHVEFAKTGEGLSGGEKCMLEVIRYLKSQNIPNILLTTNNGKSVYSKLGLKEDNLLSYITIDSYKTECYHVFLSYLIRLFLFWKIRKDIRDKVHREEDILMCHSDFFPNTLPSFILSKSFEKRRNFWWFHMQAPGIFRGFEGEFTKKHRFPSFSIIHYKLNQLLFFFCAKKGLVITVNPFYKKILQKKRMHFYVLKKFGGIEIIQSITHQVKKEFDLVFLGRFHSQKGIIEIPDIVERVKQIIPNIKMAIVGGGNDEIERELKDSIQKKNLEKNITFFGTVVGRNRLEILEKSRVFVFPSYYESYGLVALEAMKMGLPVIAYNLPVFSVFSGGMKKVGILNNQEFSREIIRLLSDSSYYSHMSKEAKSFSEGFSWKETGREVLHVIQKRLKSI